MRIPKPENNHSPEIYEAIIRECGRRPTRLGEHLQACGWTMAAAAWAIVNWDLPTLAAALANERAKRDKKPTTLSEAELAKIRADLAQAKPAVPPPQSKKTTRIARSLPEPTPRTPGGSEHPKG